MAQRWVTEEEYNQMFENGGDVQQKNPLQQFFEQLPPELQQKIQMLPPEKQQEVLMQLFQKYQGQSYGQNMSEQQQFAEGGSPNEGVPVEAERNENITTQDGIQPETEGGYLEQKSFNPISGQATYEIPNNEYNQTHPQGGVDMYLKEGDVVNSDKTKVPVEFKVYGKNFKSKTFKEASDFISNKEEEFQKKVEELEKGGKIDKVTENSVALMLTKLAIDRNNLNALQEQVLQSKKQKENSDELNTNRKEFGGLIKNLTKSQEEYNKKYDRFLNGYTSEKPFLKAEEGLQASLSKFKAFSDKIIANPNMSNQDVMSNFQKSGLYSQPSDNTFINKFSQIPSSYNPLSISTSYSPTSFKNKKGNITDDALIRKSIQYAGDIKVDPALGLAIIDIESKGNKNAKSPTGAEGYMQLTKGTAKQYGLDPNERSNPDKNLQVGFKLLKDNYDTLQKNGIEPTPINIYLAHQQGIRGAKEIISNAVNGTPISESVRKNMGYNWGDKSGAEYLRITSNKIMPLYNYYSNVLTKKDEQYSLDAHTLKNKFSLYGDPLEIKNNILKNGVKGFLQKIKTGTTNLASNSYNTNEANPQSFEHGGKILASKGLKVWGGDKNGVNKANYTDEDLNYIAKTYFPDKSFNSNLEFQKALIPFLNENFGGYQNYVIANPKGTKTGLDTPDSLYDGIMGDDWNSAIDLLKKKEEVEMPSFNFKINPQKWRTEFSDNKGNLFTSALPTEREGIINNESLKESAINTPIPKETSSKDITYKTPKNTSFLDKIRYGIGESLPYLDNIMLAMEDRIMPTLQQLPYDNPYDNMRTDYNIQSGLNENQRNLLTILADTTGNPSVRNARLAQVKANFDNSNNQLYNQKYNQELSLENQKTLGQGEYRNQFTTNNMNLQKKYEQEVLQTIENQRQQQHMAINSMMNNYLRRQEQNQALALINEDKTKQYNPYTGKWDFNPENAALNYAFQKTTHSRNSSNNDNIITLGNNRFFKKKNGDYMCLDCNDKESQNTKYGGKIKRK